MGPKKTSKVESLFDGLVRLLRNRQQQIEFLLEERKLLEDRINTQHERWISDISLCKDQILQMKDSSMEKDMEISLLEAKCELMIGIKQKEASILKLKLEQTEDELVDFKAGFDCISRLLEKDGSKNDREKEGGQSDLKSSASKKLVDEIKRLKFEYEKLSSEKSSELSALLKEKSFIWNQYNVLESDLNDKLKSKEAEIDLANNKISKLVASVEQLQSSNDQKDEMIGNLRSKLAELETDKGRLKEEVSKLTEQLKSVKDSTSTKVTPVLRAHSERPSMRAKSGLSKGNNVIVKKELFSAKSIVPLKDAEKGSSRSLKRKMVEEISPLETPKLFSNSFKVPKLKTPSVSASRAATQLQPIN